MQQEQDNMQVLPPTDDEQSVQRKRRDILPKFTLGENEGFYISRDEITELNDSYNQILSDMQESPANEELRSYMESVIFASYVSEIEKKQMKNLLESEVEHARITGLNSVLTPKWRRSIFTLFRLKRNQAAILLDELINRQARSYYYKKESELPISEEETEAELDPYVVQIETLRAYLPRMRKKKRAILEEIIAGLAASYESKEVKLQRISAELQEEKEKVEELTAEAKKEAVQRLVYCLNAVKETKKPADWEILKLREQLEEAKKAEETPVEDEQKEENGEKIDKKTILDDEEADEIEYYDEDELEEEDETDSE